MPEINAFRMDGLGNDFIIIDRRKNEIKLSKEQIIKTSDRNNVGFDQIFLKPTIFKKQINVITARTKRKNMNYFLRE